MMERWELFDELLALAQDLHYDLPHAPRHGFQDELRKELQAMSTTTTNIRPGFRTVTPYLSMKNALEVAAFMQKTFDAKITDETKTPNGTTHRELRMLGQMVMLGESLTIPGALHVFVDDVDATYARAIAAGAKTLMGEQGKPADRHYGERSAFVEDQGGNYWYISKHIGRTEPEEQPIVTYLHPRAAVPLIEFVKTVFNAEELGVFKDGDRIAHAALKIGDSMIEMGEGPDPKEQGLYVYVENPDDVYKRALSAGATSIYEPADHFYGERSGGFRDPAGNSWFVSRLL
jgi:uncharacterized glyoxalase superfamily protein PhnB